MATKPPKQPKMGRPPLPPGERMDVILRIRLTPDERAELGRAAGGDVSSWARQLLLRAAKRR